MSAIYLPVFHHFENGNNCFLGKDLLRFWALKTKYID